MSPRPWTALLLALSCCSGSSERDDHPQNGRPADTSDSTPHAGAGTHAGNGPSTGGTSAAAEDAGSGAGGSGITGSGGRGPSTNPPPTSIATATPDLDGEIGDCVDKAPPSSFEPDLQWSFEGVGELVNSYTTPLVANLTDDNGDARIDVKDTPDVVVVLVGATASHARIAVLDGGTGALHVLSPAMVRDDVSPALGDIDSDGVPEIVTVTRESDWRVGRVIALEHDGSVKWTGDLVDNPTLSTGIDGSCVALADMDNDGGVEILIGNTVFDHEGQLLWKAATDPPWWPATTAADLDGDGDLELLLGNAAYHHDGTEYWVRDDLAPGFPQVADFDADGLPEIALLGSSGLTVLGHDGSTLPLGEMNFTGAAPPAAIHDLDGDGAADLAIPTKIQVNAVRGDGSIIWSAPADDASGWAAATAFDFLGDGTAEVVYGDEHHLYVLNETGAPVYEVTRSSTTGIDYPVVADVDNDGSAELVVTSNLNPADAERSPAVQVFRDKQDRWIQARRIWNQHTYHVTNVYEDGRIPQHERPHWQYQNTFRTNVALERGGLCTADTVD